MEENCVFCENNFDYASIKEYENWSLQLFVDDQYYIGRMVVVLKNRHVVDITEIKEEERQELFNSVLPQMKSALDSVFSPDLYNYASLGNDCRHLHIHIIPRYKDSRYFNDREYYDEFWGETYSQDYQRVNLSKDEFNDLKETLREHIE
jgi:diadenosine tetraphosphate (Ap4A) HIT family hydrolase